MERSVVAKIETGRRRVTAVELARLADAVGQRLDWFVADAPPAVISRRNAADPGQASPAVDRMIERIAREVDFIQSLGRLQLPASPEVRQPRTMEEADRLAVEVRQLLGYADHEAATNLAVRSAALGLLTFSLELPVEAADGASILLDTGGVALVNGNRHVGRRRLTLAHEIGHFVFADEFSVDWRIADQSAGRRESRIDRFARSLLIPPDSVEPQWMQLREEGCDVRLAAVRMASTYRVDMATLARRLREAGVVSAADADRVRATRTTRADIVDFDLLVHEELEPPAVPLIYEKAVLDLYRSEDVSADRALELLLGTWSVDDLPQLPTLPEDAAWDFV